MHYGIEVVTLGSDADPRPVVGLVQVAEAGWEGVFVRKHRSGAGAFDVALTGYTQPGDVERPQAFAAAGVSWWLESLHDTRGSFDELLERVMAGPPRGS